MTKKLTIKEIFTKKNHIYTLKEDTYFVNPDCKTPLATTAQISESEVKENKILLYTFPE